MGVIKMPLFPPIHFGKKKKKPITEKTISDLLDKRLQGYATMDGVKSYLIDEEKDKHKLAIWDSLSKEKKVELLKYVAKKRGVYD